MAGQAVVEDPPQRRRSPHPATHVSGGLPGHRGALPDLIDVPRLEPRWVFHEHVAAPYEVAKRVGTPARSVLGGIGQARPPFRHPRPATPFAPVDKHDQGSLIECLEIRIDDPHPAGHRGHPGGPGTAHVPFAPPANRSQIDVVQIRMTVVARTQSLDEVEVPLEDNGIIHVRDEKRPRVAKIGLELVPAHLLQPRGMVRMAHIR